MNHRAKELIEADLNQKNEEVKLDINMPFGVIRSGGSIGGPPKGIPLVKGKPVVATFDSLPDARAFAKRYNKMLSPGEKKYYGIKYSAVNMPKVK